jgi:SAM-dependent methyltransferase
MTHHLSRWPARRRLKSHALLGAVLIASALALVHWTSWWTAIGAVAAAHMGIAVATHVGLALAGGGLLVAALGFHGSARHEDRGALGATIRWPRLYDWMAAARLFGHEGRLRQRTLDLARVDAGDHVLDVGCGTGTLALAAHRRAGPDGSVRGIDASAEMIARAKAKSTRSGLPVHFEVGAAQSLPYADSTFDVVLCTLVIHHLPEDARAAAVAEMRRVLKPGGRLLIVEFLQQHGFGVLLNPVAWLHGRRHPGMLDQAENLMKSAGFQGIATGPLGFGGFGYASARRD